jgi:predicted RND superfamily exporter protein
VRERGLLLWLVALALAVPAAWRTVVYYTHLHTDFEELLPRDAPSVVALDELRTRAPGLQHLGIVVDVGDPKNLPAGEKLLDDLAAKVRAYPPELVAAVRLGTTEERSFLEGHAPLYVELDDLRTVRARVEARRDWEVAKASGSLLDEDAPPPPLDVSDVQAKYQARAASKMPVGRFSSADLHLTLMLIEVGGTTGGVGKSKALLDRVKADLGALGGTEAYAPGMKVGYAADVATAVEETDGLMADLSVSSIFVLISVALVIALYFRWLRSLVVLVPPLLLATVYAFGIASLPPFSVEALNSNTAFLGSIIVGNGINFGIVLLARYVEERRKGVLEEAAMTTAVSGTLPGTLAAALAASASYGALAFTQFQGFRQFGWIGGVGMVVAWAVAFVLVPPLAMKLDGGRLKPLANPPRTIMGPLTRAIARAPVVVALVAVALTGVAAFEAQRFDASHLETDTSKLRRADTWTKGEGYWGGKMNELLGEYLTPIAILTDSPSQARAVAAHLRATKDEGALQGLVAHVRTIDDVVPPEQDAKLIEVRTLREDLTPNVRRALTEQQQKDVDRFLGPPDMAPFTARDVPATLTIGFREYDGASDGSIVLVYPELSGALWEGHALSGFVEALRVRSAEAVTGSRAPRVAGSLPLTSDILSNVEHDGPRVTLLAFLGVVVVTIALFRWRRTTAYVLVSLVVGVLWLLAATMFLGIKINFANFIAFPITFGIGIDYSVNIVARYERERDILGAVRSTGAAVGLCSLTTILGYSSLLLAENRALYLFGLLAVLGEVACLTTATVVLPAVLTALPRLGRLRPRADGGETLEGTRGKGGN